MAARTGRRPRPEAWTSFCAMRTVTATVCQTNWERSYLAISRTVRAKTRTATVGPTSTNSSPGLIRRTRQACCVRGLAEEKDLLLSFRTVLGHRYCVECKTVLGPLFQWQIIIDDIQGDGNVATVVLPNSFGVPQRFYRITVKLLP